MSLTTLFDDVTAALLPLADEIDGFSIYRHWAETPTPPAIDVYPGNPFQTGAGFEAGNNQVFLTVRARVAMADSTAGQNTLLRLLDPADPASVEVALKHTGATVSGGVSGFTQYADDSPSNERMLGCEWRITAFLN